MSQRESVIEAAEKYLFHGLVEHDGSVVPLAALFHAQSSTGNES